MTKQKPWFVRERAEAFASLVLTSRHDVSVKAQTDDRGIDLLVEVLKDGKSTLRFFGVQLVADLDLPNFPNVDEALLSHLPGAASEAALPLCVFVIDVRKPEGIYRWTVEPAVEDGRALLRRNVAVNWQTLNEVGAARLIDQVNAWYDALNGGSPPRARGRRSKTKS